MIARKSLLIVTTHYIADVLGFIGIVVLSKLWGNFARDSLGIIAFAMSTISIFSVVTDLGFTNAHIKRVSEGKDLGRCIGTFLTIKLSLTALMVLSIAVALYVWTNFLGGGFYDATTESVIIIMVFYTIFNNLKSIPIETFSGKREIAKLRISLLFENIVKVPLSIVVALAGVAVMGVSISPEFPWPEFLVPLQKFLAEHATGALAMTYVFGIMATFFVGLFLMRGYPVKRPTKAFIKNYSVYAFPIAMSAIIATVAHNIDRVMIGYYWTSANVGDYFIVQRILGFVTILYLSVGTILFPTISKKHTQKEMESVKKTVHLAERYISMIMIPPLFGIIIFAGPIMHVIFDESFAPAIPVLTVMIIYCFIRAVNTPYSTLIGGINRPDIIGKLGVTTCLANIILNYLIIPKDGLLAEFGISGATGAAFTTALSFLIAFFVLRIMAKKITGISLIQNHSPRHFISGLIMGTILYYLAYRTNYFPVFYWHSLVGLGLLGLGIYVLFLWLFREFDKQDFEFFLNIIHPKKMVTYMKEELKNNKKK